LINDEKSVGVKDGFRNLGGILVYEVIAKEEIANATGYFALV
jgi:hypothetical protein